VNIISIFLGLDAYAKEGPAYSVPQPFLLSAHKDAFYGQPGDQSDLWTSHNSKFFRFRE